MRTSSTDMDSPGYIKSRPFRPCRRRRRRVMTHGQKSRLPVLWPSSASDRKWRTSGEIRLHACRMRAENEEEEEEETLNRDTWKWVASRISRARGFDNLITRRGGIF